MHYGTMVIPQLSLDENYALFGIFQVFFQQNSPVRLIRLCPHILFVYFSILSQAKKSLIHVCIEHFIYAGNQFQPYFISRIYILLIGLIHSRIQSLFFAVLFDTISRYVQHRSDYVAAHGVFAFVFDACNPVNTASSKNPKQYGFTLIPHIVSDCHFYLLPAI